MVAAGRAGRAWTILALPTLLLAATTFHRQWRWYTQDVGRSVTLAAAGGYVVGASTWLGGSDNGAPIAWVDSLGDTTTVRQIAGLDTAAGYVCRVEDGGYVVSGTTASAGGSVLLVKTDSLGQLGIVEERPVRERFAFSVVPNPAKRVVRIECSLPMNTPTSLRLYDVAGHRVYSSLVIRTSDFHLDLRSMPAGVYLLRLDSDLGSATRKLVVE